MFGMTIGDKHTFSEFGLRMLSFQVSNPEAVKISIDIPGRDGSLDLSEAFGEVKYKNRTLTAIFDMQEEDLETFNDRFSEISNYINGICHRFIVDSDPEYYYEGRAAVSYSALNSIFYQIKISADVYPYKMKLKETIVEKTVTDTKEVICLNKRKSVVPEIKTDAEFVLSFNGSSYAVPVGTIIIPDMKFTAGENKVTCIGNGTIMFKYREGSL